MARVGAVVVVVLVVLGGWWVGCTGAVYCTAVSSGMYDTCHAGVFDRTVGTAGGSGGHRPATGHALLGTFCLSVIIIL